MSIDWRKYWWQPGFAPEFFAVSVPYWRGPYNKLGLPGAGLVVAFAAAPPDEPAP